jgi:hypothetical protein
VRSHRKASLSGWQRSGAAALVIVALAIGTAMRAFQPSIQSEQGAYVRTAAIGHAIDARSFDATVLGVRGTAVIVQKGLKHDTSGVWIIVKVKVVARGEPMGVAYAAVRDGKGNTYRASERIDQPLATASRTLQPGIPVTGEIAFEVPVGVATDLSVRLAKNPYDQRMDAVAEVHLPIDSDSVRKWKADTSGTTLATPEQAT